MTDEEFHVLIVGGGSGRLATAMLLGHHGVPSLSVERHASTAIHPRRTLPAAHDEVIRARWELEQVRAKSLETSPTGGIIAVESLAGRELAARPGAQRGRQGMATITSLSTRTRSSASCASGVRSRLGASSPPHGRSPWIRTTTARRYFRGLGLLGGSTRRCSRCASSPPRTSSPAPCARGWASPMRNHAEHLARHHHLLRAASAELLRDATGA